jgi:hypothetical protein
MIIKEMRRSINATTKQQEPAAMSPGGPQTKKNWSGHNAEYGQENQLNDI